VVNKKIRELRDMSILKSIWPFGILTREFSENFNKQFNKCDFLYKVDVEKEELYNIYLNSFSEGEERQSFNCNACHSFINNYGNIVKIENNKIVSTWNFKVEDAYYQKVLDNLSKAVESKKINSIFLSSNKQLGFPTSGGWHHFSLLLSNKHVNSSPAMLISNYNDKVSLFKRG
jgi:hypothetical protein